MAIEYLYNCIRATAGQDIEIAARITEDSGEAINDSCGLMLYSEDEMITKVDGELVSNEGYWRFILPAEITKGLIGRYYYSIYHNDKTLCFKQPLYLV